MQGRILAVLVVCYLKRLGTLWIWNFISSSRSVASEILFIQSYILKLPRLLHFNTTAKPDVQKNFYKAECLYYVLFLMGNKTVLVYVWLYLLFILSKRGEVVTCFSIPLLKSFGSWHSNCHHTVKLGLTNCFFQAIDQILKTLTKDKTFKVYRSVDESLYLLGT